MSWNTRLMLLAALAVLISFWNRNDLPAEIPLLPALADEPRQRPISASPFDVRWNDHEYQVLPKFDYELTGLVVSYRHHNEDNSRLHRIGNDHINMMDLCVVWGDTAASSMLHKINFWNGIFSCSMQTRDQKAWEAFDIYELSNNHLISDNATIRDVVQSVKIGDQIRLRGMLADYVSPGGFRRGTSITRKDTGDGACETIYVQSFDILKSGVSVWRWTMWLSLGLLLATVAIHFLKPHRPY